MKNYAFTINGQSITTPKVFEVKNPATGELLGYAPVSEKLDVEQAVAAAKAAQADWAARPDQERKEILMKVAQVLVDNTPYLAKWITQEQGKPMAGPGYFYPITLLGKSITEAGSWMKNNLDQYSPSLPTKQ